GLVAPRNLGAEVAPRLRPRLKAVVRAADPDPWINNLRGLWPWRGTAGQKAQLARLDTAQMTPALLARVGLMLSDHKEGLDLLRAAQQRYPAHFWLNFYLGNALRPEGRGRRGDRLSSGSAGLATPAQRGSQ